MSHSIGSVEAIGASGKAWVGFHAVDIADLFFNEIKLANKSIQISSFAIGHKSEEMDIFFNILEEQLENPQMKINVMVNDDRKNKTLTPYARKRLADIQSCFPTRFFPQYFKQEKNKNLNKILHAKITVIDGKIALIGSANISKGALESNYEIMLKVSGQAAVKLSKMLSHLSQQIRCDNT